MRRYRWITVGLVFAALTVSTAATAATASASSSSEIAAVRHNWAAVAKASVSGPASTLCSLMTTADAKKYLDALQGRSTCAAAAAFRISNFAPSQLNSCGRMFVKELPSQITKGLRYLSYRVVSSTEVRVGSKSANYLFEAADTETWTDVHGHWVISGGLPPLYNPECGG